MPSSNRNRAVGCMEELVKYTISMLLQFLLVDQYSKSHEETQEEKAVAKRLAEKALEGDQAGSSLITSVNVNVT